MPHLEMTLDAVPDDGMVPKDTSRSLPMALLRAREAVMCRYRPLLASLDVSEQQWRVLRVLAESDLPLDASEVAERACVLAPSLTRMIKSLEDRGLITRERDSRDGRRTMLAIAPAGIDLIRKASPDSRAICAQIEGLYGADRIQTLLDMLNDLARIKDATGPRNGSQ